jgi:hypothetical protein
MPPSNLGSLVVPALDAAGCHGDGEGTGLSLYMVCRLEGFTVHHMGGPGPVIEIRIERCTCPCRRERRGGPLLSGRD